LIKNKEDYQFLLLQRKKGRPGALGLVDKEHQKKSERSANRLALKEERRKKRLREAEHDIDRTVLESSTSTSGDEGLSEKITAENTENANNQHSKRQKLANIVTPDVAAALDRTGTSSRSATYILSAAATILGVNPKSYNISHSPRTRHNRE